MFEEVNVCPECGNEACDTECPSCGTKMERIGTETPHPISSTEFAGSALRVFIGHVQAAKRYLDNPDMGNKNYGKASVELRKATKLMPVVLKENE